MHISNNNYFIIRAVVEIAILWVVFYRILLFFEGTRAFQVLKALVI